ncbi:D-aminoacylase [Micrococcales bacterium 31B]|nr:D-aminoacylase [Micrococcales bacterium 31B]
MAVANGPVRGEIDVRGEIEVRGDETEVRHVTVLDGTGGEPYTATLRFGPGGITSIERRPDGDDGRDGGEDAGYAPAAPRLAICPGFIDLHAHSDLQILLTPEHPSRLNQGITTEVLGQDGLSYAPSHPSIRDAIADKIAGWNTRPHPAPGWATVRDYLDHLDAAGIATNAAYLVPQGVLRALVVGLDPRPATPGEIDAMCDLLAEGLDDGAVGLSAGLTYTPGMYASDAELAALCRVVAERGGYFAPHHRSYGLGALEAYAEMIDLARRTGCPLHLTHATLNFRPNAGRAGELLALIDAALDDGLDLTLDTYPYLPGSTTLAAVLPSWAGAGTTDEILARLTSPADLARLRHDLEVAGSDGCHGVTAEWETIEISGVATASLAPYVGRTLADLAAERGADPFDVFVETLLADRLATGILQHVGHEDNVRAILQHRAHTGGTDGILIGAKPHPRGWATFPRYLGHYSRDLGLLPLPEMVAHLTGRPAARLGLASRGLVREGYAADLVLFDPARIADTATFADPRQPSAGMHSVWVNGRLAWSGHGARGVRAGRALRASGSGTRPRD